MGNYTSKIAISLPTDLLKQLDEAALYSYMSRSTAIRVAVQKWIGSDVNLIRIAQRAVGKSGLTRQEELSRFLTSGQIKLLDQLKAGEIDFPGFIRHFPSEVYLKLLELGEL